MAAQFLLTFALAAIWPSKPTPYLSTTTAVAAAALVAADRQKREWIAPVAFLAFWFAYTVWMQSAAHTPSPGAVLPFVTLAFLLFFSWMPWRLFVRSARIRGPDLALLALGAAAYFAAAYHVLVADYRAWLGLFAVALACLYLALGSANYIVGSLSVGFRTMLWFGGVHGDKKLGMQQLQEASDGGRYLEPLAKIMLALAARREKQKALAQKLLLGLTEQFPESPLYSAEYAKAMGRPIPASMHP